MTIRCNENFVNNYSKQLDQFIFTEITLERKLDWHLHCELAVHQSRILIISNEVIIIILALKINIYVLTQMPRTNFTEKKNMFRNAII